MRRLGVLFALVALVLAAAPAAAGARGADDVGGAHLAGPHLVRPAETPGIGTPFMILYALHDALVKPMPGNAMAPSLAESWSRLEGRPRLRVRPPPGREVPQRRSRHRRRREVLLRALPGRGGEDC